MLRWESKCGKVTIPYTGIPFKLESQRIRECIYGGRKQKKKPKTTEVRLEQTLKM